MQPTDESIRILHVDDNPDFGELTARHLERIDDALSVGTVTSAAAGLDGSPFESALRTAMEAGETGTLEAFYPPHDTRYDVSIYPAPDGISIYFRAVDGRREDSARLPAYPRRSATNSVPRDRQGRARQLDSTFGDTRLAYALAASVRPSTGVAIADDSQAVAAGTLPANRPQPCTS